MRPRPPRVSPDRGSRWHGPATHDAPARARTPCPHVPLRRSPRPVDGSRAERILRVTDPIDRPGTGTPARSRPRPARTAREPGGLTMAAAVSNDPFSARARLRVGDRDLTIFRLDRA